MMSNDGERFRRSGFRRGYAVAEVDAFCRQAAEELRQRRAGRRQISGLTPQDVRSLRFSAERGGYREDEVDDHLDAVAAELEQLRDRAPGHGTPATPSGSPGSSSPAGPSWHEIRSLLAVADHPAGERFPRVGRLTPGYHAAQVDQFVERVRGTLTSTLTPDEVSGVQFDTARRGYDMEQVDDWLDAVQAHVRRRG